MTLLTDAFIDSLDSSIADIGAAETLPPACYTDEEFYRFERAAIFDREWLCVGRREWLEQPGDYFTTTHAGEPLIIAMHRDGALYALSAVCQHRAMLVAEGSGTTRGFVCPYHHWAYDLDGRLVGAPAMERTCGFDKASAGLPRLRLEEWHGFLFVNFDRDALPLGPRLTALEPVVSHYDMAAARGPRPDAPPSYAWNWKVMFENNNDGYHANRLHAGPLHDFVPSALASFPDLPEDTAGYYRLNGALHPDPGFNATQKAVFPVFDRLTPEERHRLLFVNLPPSLSLVMLPDMVIYLILHAEDAGHHAMTTGLLLHPDWAADPLHDLKLRMTMDAVSEIIAQDMHVDRLVQTGLRSRFAPRGRYSWQEGAQRQFNLWLVQRYRAEHDRRRHPPAPVARLHRSAG